MEGKKSFIAYIEWYEQVRELDDELAGQLFKTILAYVNDLDPQPEGILKILFSTYKIQLKRDLEVWKISREKRAEAGRKGGLAKSNNINQELAKPSNAKQSQAMQSVNVNVNDNVNVNVNNKCVIKNAPTREQVRKYVKDNKLSVKADKFFYYYDARGWKDVDNWQSLIQLWHQKDATNQPGWLTDYEEHFNEGVEDL